MSISLLLLQGFPRFCLCRYHKRCRKPNHRSLPSNHIAFLVLTTKTLTVLKLKRIKLKDVSFVDLPSLKVLHLEYVTFTYIDYLHKLLSGCPILPELEINDLTVNIPTRMSPTDMASLSNLVRANLSGDFMIGFEWLHNVEHLHIQLVCINISPLSKFITFILPY